MRKDNFFSRKEITREFINDALHEFFERGGKIRILPPEKEREYRYVPIPGSAYEEMMLFDNSWD